MYTQCPECLTVFTLDAATIAQARGTVGCGHCGATFDALATFTEHLPPEPFDTLAVHPSNPAPPVLMMAVYRQPSPQEALFEPPPPTPDATPSFARRQRRPAALRHPRRWAWGCAALALCLCAQLAWAERGALAAGTQTGPALRGLCTWLHCAPPPVSDPQHLRLLSRDIRPHPSVPGALLISATLRNDADFTQPFPVLSVTLSDLDENRIAMRRFRPAEYIHDARSRDAGLAPGATAALVFEVEDPGKNAVAFAFDFQ